MKRWIALSMIAVVAACSSLPDGGGGAVALEVVTPDTLTLKVGHSLQLYARALDLAGDSIPAVVFWHTPDTAFVIIDTVRGIVVARVASGSVRVQATTGTLLSNVITLTLADSTTPTTLRRPR